MCVHCTCYVYSIQYIHIVYSIHTLVVVEGILDRYIFIFLFCVVRVCDRWPFFSSFLLSERDLFVYYSCRNEYKTPHRRYSRYRYKKKKIQKYKINTHHSNGWATIVL